MADVMPLWLVVKKQLSIKYGMLQSEERRRELVEIGDYLEAYVSHMLLSVRESGDTLPSPPPGSGCRMCGCPPRWCECPGGFVACVDDLEGSHSGAVVVPRGSSHPPAFVAEFTIGPDGATYSRDAIVDVDNSCGRCRMLACVCFAAVGDLEGGL